MGVRVRAWTVAKTGHCMAYSRRACAAVGEVPDLEGGGEAPAVLREDGEAGDRDAATPSVPLAASGLLSRSEPAATPAEPALRLAFSWSCTRR
jgi:hypothetical protein